MKKVFTIGLGLVILALAIGGAVALAQPKAAASPAWATLNQLLMEPKQRAYFRFSPQPGVYCPGVVYIDSCNTEYDGNFWAMVDTHASLYCTTDPNDVSIGGGLWYTADDNRFLTTEWGASGRIYEGDATVPKLILYVDCHVQVIDNDGVKKNLWALVVPLLPFGDLP